MKIINTILIIGLLLLININKEEKLYINEKIENIKKEEKEICFSSFLLSIPIINLMEMVTPADEKLSNLDKYIVSYNGNKPGLNIILLGHSGSNYKALFRNVYKLNLNDKIYINYCNKVYTYIIYTIFTVKETNKSILKTSNNSDLVLITCEKRNNKNRLIVKARLLKV